MPMDVTTQLFKKAVSARLKKNKTLFAKKREKSNHVRDQVRDTFARVLQRDPNIRVSMKECGFGITYEDKVFDLYVHTFQKVEVTVHRSVNGSTFNFQPFFRFTCPMSQIGKLRQQALILQKKIKMSGFYDVHNA